MKALGGGALAARTAGSLAAVLAACATTTAEGVRSHASFTHASLAEGGIAIGPVTSALEELTQEERTRFARVLSDEIASARPTLRVAPPGAVEDWLGPAAYEELVAQYRAYASLGEDVLARLDGFASTARYLLLARVEGTDVEDTPAPEGARSKPLLVVHLLVYDLERGLSAWDGAIKAFDKQALARESEASAVGVAMLTDDPLGDTLRDSFAGFAARLPGPD